MALVCQRDCTKSIEVRMDRIRLIRTCSVCKTQTIRQRLPSHVHHAKLEVPFNNRRIDTMLYDQDNKSLLAVEILVTHEVDDYKAEDLKGIRWIEIDGMKLVNRSSNEWSILQENGLKVCICRKCAETKLKSRPKEKPRIDIPTFDKQKVRAKSIWYQLMMIDTDNHEWFIKKTSIVCEDCGRTFTQWSRLTEVKQGVQYGLCRACNQNRWYKKSIEELERFSWKGRT